MGNMYKETIIRSKLSSILKIFSILILSLYGREIMDEFQTIAVVTTTTLIVFTLFYEIKCCRVKYTYSIIADEFIIHKINAKEDRVVENIKLRDIQNVGQENLLVPQKNIFNTKKYTCSVFNLKPYFCLYREGNKLRMFYFEPSEDLVEKIIFNKERIAC
ncbi:hypothetical protein GCM10008905_28190 [Clostridium malenominatum]|uniref:Uncharacterized protein n=1 Tax=Clostridium malenominatum TaxID=1539 RepID=A0ABP3UAX9_9CLOT